MQLKSNKLFPYPVLWEEKDDYKKNDAFSISTKYSTFPKKTEIQIIVELKNDQLLSLIGSAVDVVCHIECPATKYRNSFVLGVGENNISMPSNELNGKVEIVAVLQSKIRIESYRNDDFSDFYKNMSFDIDAFSILAISSQYSIPIEKENDNLSNVSSIISIIPDSENKKTMTVSCENPYKIYIKLPAKSYSHYSAISKNESYNELIFSLLVVPTLVTVFDYLIKAEEFDVFEDYRWFRGLAKKVKDVTKNELTVELLKKSDLLDLSQKILAYPIDDAFDKIA